MDTISVLEQVVLLGGLALEAEDKAIQSSMYRRMKYGGIYHIQNERMHQLLVWRSLLSLWDVGIETDNRTDIVVRADDGDHYFEMKNWRTACGNREVPFIRADAAKLGPRNSGYILITAGQPLIGSHLTNENLAWLEGKLVGLLRGPCHCHSFQTRNANNEAIEYWIAGWRTERVFREIR